MDNKNLASIIASKNVDEIKKALSEHNRKLTVSQQLQIVRLNSPELIHYYGVQLADSVISEVIKEKNLGMFQAIIEHSELSYRHMRQISKIPDFALVYMENLRKNA